MPVDFEKFGTPPKCYQPTINTNEENEKSSTFEHVNYKVIIHDTLMDFYSFSSADLKN